MIWCLTWNKDVNIKKEKKRGLTVQVDQRVHCSVAVTGGCQRLTVLILLHWKTHTK